MGGFRHPCARRRADGSPWRYVFRRCSRTIPYAGRSPVATGREPSAGSKLAGPGAAASRSPAPGVATCPAPYRPALVKAGRPARSRPPSPPAPETTRCARVGHGERPANGPSETDTPWDAGYRRTARARPRGYRFPGSRHRPQAPATAGPTTRLSAPAHEAGQSAETSASCLHRNGGSRRRFLRRGVRSLSPKLGGFIAVERQRHEHQDPKNDRSLAIARQPG